MLRQTDIMIANAGGNNDGTGGIGLSYGMNCKVKAALKRDGLDGGHGLLFTKSAKFLCLLQAEGTQIAGMNAFRKAKIILVLFGGIPTTASLIEYQDRAAKTA